MIHIGKINTLSIVKLQGTAIYLGRDGSNNILLADRQRHAHYQAGDSLAVFVYVDADGHLAATTHHPLAQVDEIAWLKVAAINYTGVFLDWGLAKNLLVPFSEQHHEMEVGKYYLVKILLDDQNRLVASTKINRFVTEVAEENGLFSVGQKVSLLITDATDLGIKAIVNHTHWGMLYHNELFKPVHKGQTVEGYIKHIRDDGKLDLTLQAMGYGKVTSLTDTILAKLQANNGVLQLSDKSPPEAIYATFGVSKKVFKQAIGALYKDQKITLDKTEIRLV